MSSREGIEFDRGRFDRAKLGFVLLASEQTIESEMMRYVPEGVGVHFSRANNPDEITATTLAAMRDSLAPAAAVLAPNADLDVICYACTSGSVVMGEDVVIGELLRGSNARQATTLVSGVFAAFEALGVRRVAVATPYLDEVNRIEADYFANKGFDVVRLEGLNLTLDSEMVRVTPNYLRDFAISVDSPDAEAVFVSCGALRSVEVIDEIEAVVGKPVVTSNQGMLWHCRRLSGIDDRLDGMGRLTREH